MKVDNWWCYMTILNVMAVMLVTRALLQSTNATLVLLWSTSKRHLLFLSWGVFSCNVLTLCDKRHKQAHEIVAVNGNRINSGPTEPILCFFRSGTLRMEHDAAS